MKAHFPALYVLASVALLPAATVEQRLHELESNVSEMQILLEQLSQRGTAPAPRPVPNTPSQNQYQVRRGDSYWSIARRNGITVADLERANPGVNPRRLTIGKYISIPGLTSPAQPSFSATKTYHVKKGDVLGRIAKAHGISLKQLMKANPGVDPRRLRIGKALNIPGQKAPTPPPAKPAPKPRPSPPVETKSGLPETPTRPTNPYLRALDSTPPIVEAHDEAPPELDLSEPKLITLDEDTRFSNIAQEHKTTVATLNRLNQRDLSPQQMIRAGSQLYIPGR